VLWANLHLLFWLSLYPFTTAWTGRERIALTPTVCVRRQPARRGHRYYLLQLAMIVSPDRARLPEVVGNDLKGKLSPVIYLAGILLAFVEPWLALIPFVVVALIWLVPTAGSSATSPSTRGSSATERTERLSDGAIGPGDKPQSKQNSLPSGSCMTMKPWLMGGSGSKRRTRDAPRAVSRSHSASRAGHPLLTLEPRRGPDVEMEPVLGDLALGHLLEPQARSDAVGSTEAEALLRSSRGRRSGRAPPPRWRSRAVGRRSGSRAPRSRTRRGRSGRRSRR
jgi:hypothetical protein